MFKIAFHPSYVLNLPAGHRFPMEKYELIPLQLLHQGIVTEEQFFEPDKQPTMEDILAVHQASYVSRLLKLALSPKEVRRSGFPLSRELVDRELRIACGTVQGAEYALENGMAFNVAGGTHHAGSDWAEGFCLLNDQAIAAAYLLRARKISRVAIVDLDVHQGNGTAEIFRGRREVFTFSIHAAKNFPFHKESSDLDIALKEGMSGDEYLTRLEASLLPMLDSFQPEFVFYQAGVDVLETDKLGHLSLSRAACAERDALVFRACQQRAIPMQISMGGGYSTDIKDIVEAHCNTYREALAHYS